MVRAQPTRVEAVMVPMSSHSRRAAMTGLQKKMVTWEVGWSPGDQQGDTRVSSTGLKQVQ